MPAVEPGVDFRSRSRLWRERFVRWGPWGVPLLYLALIFLLQPWSHLGPPDGINVIHQFLYDDHDVTAMALRGLNAHLGRSPGFVERPQGLENEEVYARGLLEDRPLKERYWLEYPHAALALFRLPYALQKPLPPVPPALLDGDYIDIVYHHPQTAAEQELYYHLRGATRLYLCVMVLCFLGLVAVLRAGYEPGGGLSAPVVLLLLPALLYFTLHRFDVIPALLTALSLACLGRRRPIAAGAFLAIGVLVKVYPVLLAPLILRYLWPQRRQIVAFTASAALTGAAFVLPVLITQGWESFWSPYSFQLNRPPDGAHIYGVLLPLELSENTPVAKAFRLGCVLLTVAFMVYRPIVDLPSLLRRAALVLLMFVTVPVFYSPQWILWFAPLLLPLIPLQPKPSAHWLIGFILGPKLRARLHRFLQEREPRPAPAGTPRWPPLVEPARLRQIADRLKEQSALLWMLVILDGWTFLCFPLTIPLFFSCQMVCIRYLILTALAAVLIQAEWFEKAQPAERAPALAGQTANNRLPAQAEEQAALANASL